MTVVEFFEKSPFENMVSTLLVKPKKLILLGDEKEMSKAVSTYEAFLESKETGTKIEPVNIDKNDLKDIEDKLTKIIKTEQNCIFDITGGEDLVLLGCGIVFAKYHNQYPFKMQRVDIKSGKITDCFSNNKVNISGGLSLSVKELIKLHGGIVAPEPFVPNLAHKRDVDAIWDIARQSNDTWNDSLAVLCEFEKRTVPKQNRMNINIDLQTVSAEIRDYNNKFNSYYIFIKKLLKNGLIDDLNVSGNRISYNYKNATVRRCLHTPGDILEMKTYYEAFSLTDNGKPYFDSCNIGVTIDWDGVIHNPHDTIKDTKNEIDVMLMRAITPVFISCKNGDVPGIELYKLNTVAERFGGKHAKKILIATNFERESQNSERAYIQRAKDMDITFITDAAQFNDNDWKTLFKETV